MPVQALRTDCVSVVPVQELRTDCVSLVPVQGSGNGARSIDDEGCENQQRVPARPSVSDAAIAPSRSEHSPSLGFDSTDAALTPSQAHDKRSGPRNAMNDSAWTQAQWMIRFSHAPTHARRVALRPPSPCTVPARLRVRPERRARASGVRRNAMQCNAALCGCASCPARSGFRVIDVHGGLPEPAHYWYY